MVFLKSVLALAIGIVSISPLAIADTNQVNMCDFDAASPELFKELRYQRLPSQIPSAS